MDDAFAFLGLPRRPWLEEKVIRAAFQERARRLHPDAPGGDAEQFAALNAAQAALADPASRLLLLTGENTVSNLPADAEFGFRLASVLREADGALAKAAAARNPLEQALHAVERAAVREKLAAIAEELSRRFASADERLRELDAAWPDATAAPLAAEYRFLQRWRSQLHEREIAISL